MVLQMMRLRSDPVTLLEGSPSAVVGVPGGEAAGGGQGLAPSTAQVKLHYTTSGAPHESTERAGVPTVGANSRGINCHVVL